MTKLLISWECINLKHTMTTSDYEIAPIGIRISDMKFRIQMNFIDARAVYAHRSMSFPNYVSRLQPKIRWCPEYQHT